MERQQSRRSVLILLAVAIIVIGVVVVKSLPTEEAAPAQPTPADHPVRQSADAVPEDSTRYGTGEEALAVGGGQVSSAVEEEGGAPAPVVPRPPAKPEPKEPRAEPAPDEPTAEAVPEASPPGPVPSSETAASPEEAQEPIEPLPGPKLANALASGQPTMADFGAGWCQACKMMDPVLRQAAQKYEGRANIVYVDTDKFPQMARSYKIRAIPTQIFFDSSGKEVNRHMGYWPIEEVDKQLAALGVGG